MMTFEQFLQKITQSSWWQQPSVVCIGLHYPSIFFTDLFAALERTKALPFSRILVPSSSDPAALMTLLHQSMLGQSHLLWCGNPADLYTTARAAGVYKSLAMYQGPHVAMYFVPESVLQAVDQVPSVSVALPAVVTPDMFVSLAQVLYPSIQTTVISWYVQQCIMKYKMSLDGACQVLRYLAVLPTELACTADALAAILKICVQQTPVLRQLADRFFAKDAAGFFAIWPLLASSYPAVFWHVFWAEQLWGAYHGARYLRAGDFVKAKRVAVRLPYSYLDRYAKQSSLTQLKRQYRIICQLDYLYKQGSQNALVEYLYVDQFHG